MSRTGRFIERALPESSEPIVSLNDLKTLLFDVPEDIDFNEALLSAGVDASFVIDNAMPAVKRASANGVLKKLNISEEEALIIAAFTVQCPEGSLSMCDALNNVLRGARDRDSLVRTRMLLVLFLRTLRQLPMVHMNELYRGIDSSLLPLLKNDTVLTWWAFTSLTWNADATNAFVGASNGLFILKGPCKGYDLSELSVCPEESEFLLEPETLVRMTTVINMRPTILLVNCCIKPSELVLQEILLLSLFLFYNYCVLY